MKSKKTIFASAVVFGIISVILTIHGAFAQTDGAECLHTTVTGDSYAAIAAQYGIEVWELQDLNRAQYPVDGALQTGWDLVVPCVDGASKPDEPTSTEESSVDENGIPIRVRVIFNEDTTVKAGPGETFATLGTRFVNELIEAQARNAQSTWLYYARGEEEGWFPVASVTALDDISVLPVSATAVVPGAAGPTTIGATTYTGQFYNIGPHLKAIYQRGQAVGNNPNAFSKIGDSDTAKIAFLSGFDHLEYDLGAYQYLAPVVNQFQGSFARSSIAAHEGFPVESVFNPLWAHPDFCGPTESPIECEYRIHKPSFALVLLRTSYQENRPYGDYYYAMQSVIEYLLDQGVIPVLSTIPYQAPPLQTAEDMNETIRLLSRQYNIPMWDIWVTSEALPDRGVDFTWHLTIPADEKTTYFTDEYLGTYGMTHRNLEALEVLHALLAEVVE